MALSTTDYNALTEYLDEIFNEAASARVATDVGMSIFDVKDSNEKTYLHQVLHGVAGIQKVTEGSDLPQVNSEEGDSVTFTQNRYGALIPITKDMRLFDRFDEIEAVARTISGDAFDKIDTSMSDVLLNGWSTSYSDVYGSLVTSLGPDSLALFSASHTNGTSSTTYKNIMNDGTNDNPALSRTAIVKEKATARGYTDPNGIHRPIRLDTIVVGPTNEDLAHRIINSDLIQGSANNDTNMNVRGMNIKTWDRLDTNSAGTDTSAYWFMYDSSLIKNTLKAVFAQKPMLMAPDEVYKNKNWNYSIDFYYALGRGFAPYLRGSKGTNA